MALGSQVGGRREAVHQHLVDHGAVAPVGLARFEDAGEFAVEAVGAVHVQPFTPPAVSPETIQRCAARNTSVIGSPLSTAAAAKSPHRYFWS